MPFMPRAEMGSQGEGGTYRFRCAERKWVARWWSGSNEESRTAAFERGNRGSFAYAQDDSFRGDSSGVCARMTGCDKYATVFFSSQQGGTAEWRES